jgi:hypothetical protein
MQWNWFLHKFRWFYMIFNGCKVKDWSDFKSWYLTILFRLICDSSLSIDNDRFDRFYQKADLKCEQLRHEFTTWSNSDNSRIITILKYFKYTQLMINKCELRVRVYKDIQLFDIFE